MNKKVVIILIILIVIAVYIWNPKPVQEINATIVNTLAQTRGYKNNNPGNIKDDGVQWQGEVKPSTDPPFKQFQGMDWGYRAMFVNLRGYMRQGIDTINTIISTWAPPSDNNDTPAYITDVANRTGYDPDQQLTLTDEDVLKAIVTALEHHEQGVDAIPSQVDDGWTLFQNS